MTHWSAPRSSPVQNRKSPEPLNIALVAGEASGDNLGASLMNALAARHPGSKFIGIGGDKMREAGQESWIHSDELSVNGIVEPLKRLPSILRTLYDSRDRILAAGVDCFVGIDFNFFNLWLAGLLRARGVTTVHYVSPTVWAWRTGRLKKIRRSVDLMLTLYPFETAIYEQQGIRAAFVGHPRADLIEPLDGESPEDTQRKIETARREAAMDLGVDPDILSIALLPGSRGAEVASSGVDFLAAAGLLQKRLGRPVQFLIPAANPRRLEQIESLLVSVEANMRVLVNDDALQSMAASHLVLANGGTATLEAMLLRKPMVMSYRLGAATYALVSRMMKIEHFALPNILAGRALVPELIQNAATPEHLAAAVEAELTRDPNEMLSEFGRIHSELRQDAGARAADAILALIRPSLEAGASGQEDHVSL